MLFAAINNIFQWNCIGKNGVNLTIKLPDYTLRFSFFGKQKERKWEKTALSKKCQNKRKMTVFRWKTVIFDWNPATCYPPGRYVPSTFTADELNFCVRNGNRWILVAIITGMAPLVGLEAVEWILEMPENGAF